ncbi:hypothetical protein EB796_001698 [Bugula neritina]|uniref:Transmembrane 9 superfamily member n=1 Tax=Bugula neritina TaxID=10212 RepID=A0A7J7KPA4_BUGNE|nr:hypothetical protein EB796_001698 [Bugula neritina]
MPVTTLTLRRIAPVAVQCCTGIQATYACKCSDIMHFLFEMMLKPGSLPPSCVLIYLVIAAPLTVAYYFPSASPNNYCDLYPNGTEVPNCPNKIAVYAGSLDSSRSVLAFNYNRFPFCSVEDGSASTKYRGLRFFTDKIVKAPINLEYRKQVACNVICEKEMIIPGSDKSKNTDKSKMADLKSSQLLMRAIQLNYQQHWLVDDIPVQLCYKVQVMDQSRSTHCERSFPIGCYVDEKGEQRDFCNSDIGRYTEEKAFYLFNHLDIVITYHPAGDKSEWLSTLPDGAKERNPGRIIDIKVTVSSVNQIVNKAKDQPTCEIIHNAPPLFFKTEEESKAKTVAYSYSVNWMRSDMHWSYRWNKILQPFSDANVLKFTLINNLVVLAFCTLASVVVVKRINCTTRCTLDSQVKKEFAWRKKFEWTLIHGDLFKSPRRKMLVSLCVGQGSQFTCAALLTLCVASFGVLSPANPGAIMLCSVICYVLSAFIAGILSTKVYKAFGGLFWKTNTALTSFLVPGIFYGWYVAMNLIIQLQGGDNSTPFSTLAILLALWLCVSAPLTFAGAYVVARQPNVSPYKQAKDSLADTQPPVPKRQARVKQLIMALAAGVLPLGAIFLHIYFILNNLWFNQVYDAFGLLLVMVVIFIVLTMEEAILFGHFQLRLGITNWHTRVLGTGGLAAFYLFMYIIHFIVKNVSLEDSVSKFIVLSYTLMATFAYFLAMACWSFLPTWLFFKRMYAVVSKDFIHQPLSLEQTEVEGQI